MKTFHKSYWIFLDCTIWTSACFEEVKRLRCTWDCLRVASWFYVLKDVSWQVFRLCSKSSEKNVPKRLILLSLCYAADTQRVPLRTPSTARCRRPGGTSWPGSDRGSWPTQFTTSGRRAKTSLLLDTSTLVSGRAVRNTMTVSSSKHTSNTRFHGHQEFVSVTALLFFHLYKFCWQGRNVGAL